jgi:hypothetical protein
MNFFRVVSAANIVAGCNGISHAYAHSWGGCIRHSR